jgi:2-oxoglutarate ferredoxin oxidoreductase subunit beta
VHSMRRAVNMVYIVMNNGVYGLTKGQFSATADQGSRSKRGVVNNDAPVDLAALALQLGVSFVARSFSGNKEQLVPLIEAALSHRGAAFIDVISPCVAFNNHPGSTKSYDYVREHNESVNYIDFVPHAAEISVPFAPGTVQEVQQHDGSVLRLRTLNQEFDVHDRIAAMNYLHQRQAEGEVVTGLLHIDPSPEDLHGHLNTSDQALNLLDETVLCPGAAALERINASLR